MRLAIRSAGVGLALGLISGSVFLGGDALAQSVAQPVGQPVASGVSLKGVLKDESGAPLYSRDYYSGSYGFACFDCRQ